VSPLERYRSIIPDWDDFLEVVQRRDPPAIRARTGRIGPAELQERLERRGFVLEPFPGLPDHLKVVDAPYSVAQTPEHWLGMFYVQQAATGVAAIALDPQPRERVLDLCAAPGGKTTHLSDLMDDRGCLLAVDVSENRLRGLLGNVYRTGHSNIVVVAADGGKLPGPALFDRVLVDAPCSAEGTLRKRKGKLREQSTDFRHGVVRRQERLLRRAIELTRPGGTVLYSTCTFAPEENEGVLSTVLDDMPVEVVPLGLAAPHAPGVSEFQGRVYDPRVERAARVYPHHLDSGGLFLALLRKADDESVDPDVGWGPVPDVFPGEPEPEGEPYRAQIRSGLDFMDDPLGFDGEELRGYDWMWRGGNVWANRAREWPIDSWEEGGHWRTISVGLRGLSPGPGGWLKPTNDLLRILEHVPQELKVELTDGEWEELLARRTLPVEGPNGIRVLMLEGRIAGRGIVKDGRLRHEMPKAQAGFLRDAFDARSEAGALED